MHAPYFSGIWLPIFATHFLNDSMLLANLKVVEALERSGFKILEHGDLVDKAEEWYGDRNVPWYLRVVSPCSLNTRILRCAKRNE